MSYTGWSQIWRLALEVIFVIIIAGLLFFTLTTNTFYQQYALYFVLILVGLFGVFDCFVIRGKCKNYYKKEKATNASLVEYTEIIKNYLNDENQILKVKNGKSTTFEIEDMQGYFYDLIFPVGAVVIMKDNPSSLFGGTWAQIQGNTKESTNILCLRMSDDNEQNPPKGEYAVTLNQFEIPYHKHKFFDLEEINTRCSAKCKKGVMYILPKSVATAKQGNKFILKSFNTKATAHNNMPKFYPLNIWERIQ